MYLDQQILENQVLLILYFTNQKNIKKIQMIKIYTKKNLIF